MKLTAVLLVVCGFQVSAKAISQTVTFSAKDVTVETVFSEIKKQTGYVVFCSYDILLQTKPVTVNAKDMPLSQFMKEVLRDQSLDFSIANKTILIRQKQLPVTGSISSPLALPPVIIHGKISNEKGEPIEGVSVFIKGSTEGVTTNSNGEFSINSASDNAVLVISHVNFGTEEVAAKGQTQVNITLKEKSAGLNEIVVVGYGTQRKKDITGAVSTISSKELEDRPNTQFGYAIEGKAAGVNVIRASGQPQAGFSIRIRGTSTITAGSEPLYIVDGVPTTATNEINPADIESLTVLKDASSAAIYGASGANGVVLITTRRGKNQKTKLSFDTYTGFSNAWKKLPVLTGSQYIDLMTEMGLSPSGGWGSYSGTNTNWQDQVFRNANTQSYNLSVGGGNENTQYFMSGSVLKQEGIAINNSVNRVNFRTNLDHKISKVLKVGTSISYNKWTDIDTYENSRNGVIMGLITGAPVIKIFNDDGTYTANPLIADVENPVAAASSNDHKWTNNRFNGNVYLEAYVLPGLKLRSMLGYEQTSGAYNSFVNPFQSREGRTWKGIADQTLSQYNYWISENTVTYDKKFGEHNLTALAGFVTSKSTNNSLSEHATGFGGSAVTTVNGGAIQTLSGANITERSNVSFLSRVNYTYSDRYLLTANFRADASSVFGPSSRWGYFPSFSAGWRISKEKFFNVEAISDLKLRAGWGLVGNDQVVPYSYFGLVGVSHNYEFNNAAIPGTAPSTLENDKLKWETTDQLNIGLDVSVLNNRISLSTDYYIKKTRNLLLNLPMPLSGGFPFALGNVGKIENRGIEFLINTRNLVGEFSWTTDFNISFNKNEVLDMLGSSIKIGAIENRGNSSIAKVGSPLGTFWGYIYDGVDPATGDAVYRDLDKNGTIDESDKAVIGNANPKYTFGLTNSFKYKNFSLTVFVQGIQGNQIFNGGRVLSEGMTDGKSQSAAVLKRWTSAGQITDVPRQSLNDPGVPDPTYNSLISSRFIENGSYLRIKSLTLGYNLPDRILGKTGISRCMIYVTGENLLTFTNYSGFDPEVSAFGGTNQDSALKNIAPGVDFGTYPQSRELIFGLNISF